MFVSIRDLNNRGTESYNRGTDSREIELIEKKSSGLLKISSYRFLQNRLPRFIV
jgi:hypothetical protein